MLAAWPDAIKESDAHCNTTVQMALMHKASDAVVLALIAACPDRYGDGSVYREKSTLHVALQCKASEAVAMAVFAAWPEAAKEKNWDGYIPLHIALKHKASEALVVALLAAWPDAVKERAPKARRSSTKHGAIPLHIALENRAPGAVVLALVAAWPDAVKEETNDKATPLHIAVKHKASEAVVAALLAAWPDAVRGETGDGHIPLYIAVKHKASTAVVVALIAAWPDAVKGKTGDGQIALHIAMQCCASDAVARALIASFPAAVQEVTYRRRKSFNRSSEAVGHDTPLHLLAAGKCNTVAACRSTNTLCFTLVEKGGSLAATNAHGNTPPEVATQQNKLNYHLVASFREIALFKQHHNITTAVHAWGDACVGGDGWTLQHPVALGSTGGGARTGHPVVRLSLP